MKKKETPVLGFLFCFLAGPLLLIGLYFFKYPLASFQYLGLAAGFLWTFMGPVIWWQDRRGIKPRTLAAEIQKIRGQTATSKQQDIGSFLREYSADGYPVDTIKPVICPECGCEVCLITLDPDESVIQVSCENGGHTRLLLDSADYWDKCNLQELVCPDCGDKRFKTSVGLAHRESGEVKWVFIGCQCQKCGGIGCPSEWEIDYGPTDEMEKNI